MKSVAETMLKQYKFKKGWVWSFFAKFFYDFLCILMGIYFLFFAIFANTNFWIVTKSHSTPVPIIPHVLIYVLCMCAQSCGTSHVPKFGRRKIIRKICMRNNRCVPVCVLYIWHTQKHKKKRFGSASAE